MYYKKFILFVLLFVSITVLISWIVFQNNNTCDQVKCADTKPLNDKIVTLSTYSSEVVNFYTPIDWNIFYNGDSELLNSLDINWGVKNITASVSVPDKPVTHTDINWEQLDFYITDGNLISDEFVNKLKDIDGKIFNEFQLDDFIGYSSTDILESKIPSKADTGGTTYYLIPKIDSVTWNLIINKQSLGSDEFEIQVKDIINSLQVIDYDKYINELNN